MKKKLLYIRPESDRSIDECLMIVPEDYVEAEMLERAEEAGIDSPYVAAVIEIDLDTFADTPADERPFIG